MSCWLDTNWEYRMKVTIDQTKVDSGLLAFPIYLDLSDISSSHSFWSNVNSDGSDIRITKSDGESKVAREIVSIDTGNNTGQIHFDSDKISSTKNVDYFIYYGNSSASEPANSDTFGRDNVWSDKSYNIGYHLDESSGNATDFTGNGNTGTITGASLGTSAKIGDGLSFDGDGDKIEVAQDSNFNFDASQDAFSISFIFKTSVQDKEMSFYNNIEKDPDGDTIEEDRGIAIELISKNDSTADSRIVGRFQNNVSLNPSTRIYFESPTEALADGSLHEVTITYSGGGGVSGVSMYIDGVSKTLQNTEDNLAGTQNTLSNNSLLIGLDRDGNKDFNGVLDEIRIIDKELTENWVTTQFNNTDSPDTFHTFGSQLEGSSADDTGRVFPLTLPSDPPFEEVNFRIQNLVGETQSPFTGESQLHEWQGEFWTAELKLPPMPKNEARDWVAFLTKLRGKVGTFKVGDPAGKSQRGTLNGTPKVTGPGNSPLIVLDGTDDSVDITDSSDFDITSKITVEAWVSLSEVGTAEQVIASKAPDDNRQKDWELGVTSGDKPYFIIGDGSENKVTADKTLEKGMMAHVVGVYDGSELTIFINGRFSGGKDLSTTITNGDSGIRIGGRTNGSSFFQGDISDVRLWDTDRSFAEIIDNMDSQLAGTETNLVGYWKLDDNSGSSATDSTSNGNNGTLQNDAKFSSSNGRSLVTKGWNANEQDLMLPGDYFELNDRLKMVTNIVCSMPSGVAVLDVQPQFRVNTTADDKLITDDPKGEFRLSTNEAEWTERAPLIYEGISLPIKEVI